MSPIKDWPFLIFLSVIAIIGILGTPHYGESWDELKFYKYADHALASYRTWIQRGEIIVTGNTYDNYGPAFVIFTSSVARTFNALNPNWLISDLRHFVYFFNFLAGVWAFHDLAKRWLSQTAALTSTLLFLTQPLFWGHAFISPKDIPFMSLFLLSLSFGFRMADSVTPISFDSTIPSAKRNLPLLTALWLASVIASFAATAPIRSALADLVQSAADGQTNIISLLASDIRTAAPEIYVQKFFLLFLQIRSVYFYLSTCSLVYLYHRFKPSFSLFHPSIFPAAILLGLTTSTRILGPLAGLIVTYYALRTKGKQAVPSLAVYALFAMISTYAAWPYLWPDPPGHLLESVQVMSQYPWKGQVLFNGQYYASTELPYSYLPVLLAIQFTEPVWLLFIIGLCALRKNNIAIVSTLLWFVLPLIGLIVTRAPLYDNTRQIFFILPPVFLVAGLGVDSLFKHVSRPMVKAGIAALLLLPGLVAAVRLHPYEYVYYNSLVGNPTGRFELDYWGTSYREAAQWLNRNAPANAKISIGEPAHIAAIYLREDLKVVSEGKAQNAIPDYVILSTRYDADKKFFAEYEVVHKIERAGLIFSVIKKLK